VSIYCRARIICGEPGAQAPDSGAHFQKLGVPVGAQLRIVEDGANDRAPMIGRHRPHGARKLEEIAERDLRLLGAGRLDEERSGPLAIKSEILVAALGDQRLIRSFDNQPSSLSVGFKAVAETLIGEIDVRNEAALETSSASARH
jgi:hypothetical protein